ncbi:PII-like signaling protein [Collimonas sp. OK242]|jgi:PII-like signaling protein|uniref:DUF190 domain-containing protein n=1 Tax=Collimonas sp. OK242 TaxID=1798195 RepID=UPI00089820CC|nr:DUF190 domain-containing protein [Collimonas sp. OK242]SDX26600.1 PII-like signaling protein [Collimonas sp. OK242]
MKGFQLEFFTQQDRRHKGKQLSNWLLDVAHSHGIRGATVFTGAIGYGHDRRFHSAHFFELADQPVEVTMVVSEEESDRLFEFLLQEGVHMFYVKLPVEFGKIGQADA